MTCSYCGQRPVFVQKLQLCKSCREYLRTHGTLERKPRLSTEDRFWSFVDMTPNVFGCWRWTASRDVKGYGVFSAHAQYSRMAHRTAWLILRGPIPVGLQLDHLCLDKACVNPDHLEIVTNEENSRRAKEYRISCRRGHPYDEKNTFVEGNGKRGCRICREAARQRFHERNPSYYSVGRSEEIRPGGAYGPQQSPALRIQEARARPNFTPKTKNRKHAKPRVGVTDIPTNTQ